MEFEGIKINTDYQLYDGIIKTTYDFTWGNVEEVKDSEDSDSEDKNEDGDNTDSNNGNTDTEGEEDEDSEDTEGEEDEDSEDSEGENDPKEDGEEDPKEESQEDNDPKDENEGDPKEEDPKDPKGTEETSKESLYIKYKGKKYSDGKTIKIAFSRDKKVSFEAYSKEKLSEENIEWSIHNRGKEEGFPAGTELKEEINIPYLIGEKDLLLEDKSSKEKVRIKIKIEYKDPNISNFISYDKNNKKRIAKADETLYFVNKPTVSTEKRTVVSEMNSIDSKFIPKENLKWYKNGNLEDNKTNKPGDKRIALLNKEKEDLIIKLIHPKKTFQNKIVWVDEDKAKYKAVPIHIQTKINSVFSNLEKIKKITNKYGGKFKIEPKIVFSGTQINKEDKKTRFYNIVREGGVEAGVDVKLNKPIYLPYPFSISLTIPIVNYKIGTIGAYIDPHFKIRVDGKIKKEKRNDKKEFIKKSNNISLSATGGVEFGAEVNILPEVKSIELELKFYGKSALIGKGKLVIKTDGTYEFKPEVYIEPLIGGFKGTIKAGTITVFDQSFEWRLLDRINIID